MIAGQTRHIWRCFEQTFRRSASRSSPAPVIFRRSKNLINEYLLEGFIVSLSEAK